MSLEIVKPITITDAILTASNVLENDHAAWDSATAYVTGNRVIVVATHSIYEALRNSTNKPPATSPDDWIFVSPTNKWAMFDTSNTTKTRRALTMSCTITPGRVINTVAAIGVTASTAQVIMTDPVDGVVYDKIIAMLGVIPSPTWHAYFFADTIDMTEAVFNDMPSYGTANVQIIFDRATGDVSCAALLIGQKTAFGVGVEYGATVGIVDYSRKEADIFGNVNLVRRASAKRIDIEMLVPKNELQGMYQFFGTITATPCLWIGKKDFDLLTVYGWFNEFEISIDYPTYAFCSLEITGMT